MSFTTFDTVAFFAYFLVVGAVAVVSFSRSNVGRGLGARRPARRSAVPRQDRLFDLLCAVLVALTLALYWVFF